MTDPIEIEGYARKRITVVIYPSMYEFKVEVMKANSNEYTQPIYSKRAYHVVVHDSLQAYTQHSHSETTVKTEHFTDFPLLIEEISDRVFKISRLKT